ncbi:hypothetical protein [Streptomyces sp. NPDC058308]|uniref:hypothetical protein n=1 Tax=Streptomyces sp. NPDC058308 TaxID=3346440 RepID=UPI0036E8DCBD
MNAPAPSRRTVGLVVGALLVIVGAALASIAVFGGSATPDPESSRPSSAQPTKPASKPQDGQSAGPTAGASCLLYDFECQAEGGSAVVPRQSSVLPADTGGTGGYGHLFGGTG